MYKHYLQYLRIYDLNYYIYVRSILMGWWFLLNQHITEHGILIQFEFWNYKCHMVPLSLVYLYRNQNRHKFTPACVLGCGSARRFSLITQNIYNRVQNHINYYYINNNNWYNTKNQLLWVNDMREKDAWYINVIYFSRIKHMKHHHCIPY